MAEVNEDKECPVCFEDFTSKLEGNSNITQASHDFCCGKLICVACWSAMDAASTTGLCAPCPYCRAPRPSVEDMRVLLLGHAEKGNKAWAQYKLGVSYHVGDHGFPKSLELAVHWFALAANQGYVDAQFALASMYYSGEGLPQSYEKTVELFTLAANQGHKGAIAMLPCTLLTLVKKGRTDLRCEALYRTKIALKLPPSELPEKARQLYLQYIEEAKITCGGCVRVKKEGEGDLSLCNGCQCIYYCNRECQKAHWKEHKPACQRISSS
jgi:hypothetical protein